MLIKIDETVTEYIIENYSALNEDSPEIEALDNIAKALSEGYHVISASLEVLEVLAKLELLENKSQRMYSYLLSKFVFLPAYEDFCSEYILVKSNSFEFSINEEHNKYIFEVPIKYFTKLVTVTPTALVSEDLSDCLFYERLAKKYIEEKKKRLNINLCFDHTPGNGDGTYKSYEYKIRQRRLSLAIGDSDKSYPDDNIGTTLLKISTVYNTYKANAIAGLFQLNVREKENLISPSLYLLSANSSAVPTLKKLYKLETSNILHTKLKYIDLKDGIKARTLKTNENRKKYLEEVFRGVSELVACTYEEIDNQEDEFRIMEGVGREIDVFYNDILGNGLELKLAEKKKIANEVGIPESVIKRMEENIAIKSNLFDHLPEYLKDEWENLCIKVISWGCCAELIA
jgi:hypothetical protein